MKQYKCAAADLLICFGSIYFYVTKIEGLSVQSKFVEYYLKIKGEKKILFRFPATLSSIFQIVPIKIVIFPSPFNSPYGSNMTFLNSNSFIFTEFRL